MGQARLGPPQYSATSPDDALSMFQQRTTERVPENQRRTPDGFQGAPDISARPLCDLLYPFDRMHEEALHSAWP